MHIGIKAGLAGLVVGMVVVNGGSAAPQIISAATKPGAEWKPFATRTLADLPVVTSGPVAVSYTHLTLPTILRV